MRVIYSKYINQNRIYKLRKPLSDPSESEFSRNVAHWCSGISEIEVHTGKRKREISYSSLNSSKCACSPSELWGPNFEGKQGSENRNKDKIIYKFYPVFIGEKSAWGRNGHETGEGMKDPLNFKLNGEEPSLIPEG
jgi:hypothetical protein